MVSFIGIVDFDVDVGLGEVLEAEGPTLPEY